MTDIASLLADPTRVAEVPVDEAGALIGQLEQVKALLYARLTQASSTSDGRGEDRCLTVEEAAGRLGVTKDWLRRRGALPFVVKLSEGIVRYSSRGLERWIAAHTQK